MHRDAHRSAVQPSFLGCTLDPQTETHNLDFYKQPRNALIYSGLAHLAARVRRCQAERGQVGGGPDRPGGGLKLQDAQVRQHRCRQRCAPVTGNWGQVNARSTKILTVQVCYSQEQRRALPLGG